MFNRILPYIIYLIWRIEVSADSLHPLWCWVHLAGTACSLLQAHLRLESSALYWAGSSKQVQSLHSWDWHWERAPCGDDLWKGSRVINNTCCCYCCCCCVRCLGALNLGVYIHFWVLFGLQFDAAQFEACQHNRPTSFWRICVYIIYS